MTDAPMLPSEAVQQGICPMCYGRKVMGSLVLCLHTDGHLCHENDTCVLCNGSGAWPPPYPSPVEPASL